MTVNYSCSQCECEYTTRHVLLHHIKSDTKLFLPHTPCPAGWPQGTLHSHSGLLLAAAYCLLQAMHKQNSKNSIVVHTTFFCVSFSETIYLLHSQYYIIAWPDETVLNKKVLIQSCYPVNLLNCSQLVQWLGELLGSLNEEWFSI